MSQRILIADDEAAVRQLLDLVLRGQGYDVIMAQNGDELVRMAQDQVPDLVLVDLMMPGVDGYEAIRQLRNDTRTSHIPMLILTARSTPGDVVIGFETGADDYITKPFNIPELLARIKSHLRRAARRSVRSPLTDLPGNFLLTEELKYRIRQPELFALLHIDLDNFKAFNDTYGFARGDLVIKLVAEILLEAVELHGSGNDFIGHIGGDDFALMTTPEAIDRLCPYITETFDERVRGLYDPEEIERGYLQGVDRQGVPRRFPIITISIGGVTNRHRDFTDHDEVSRVAAEMKHFAKQQSGSYYAIDVRGSRSVPVGEDRRGKRTPAVLLLTPDPPLLGLLRGALQRKGYRTLEAPGIPEAHAVLTHADGPTVIVADARLGEPLWELAETLKIQSQPATLMVITTRAEDQDIAAAHGAQAYLKQPFLIEQFLTQVSELMLRHEE